MGLFQYSWYFGLCSCLSVVLSAVYSLYLYNKVVVVNMIILEEHTNIQFSSTPYDKVVIAV